MMHNDNNSKRIQNNDTIVNIYLWQLVFQYEYLFVLQFFIINYFVCVCVWCFGGAYYHIKNVPFFVSIIILLISVGNTVTYKALSVPVVHKNTSKIHNLYALKQY